MMRDYNSHNTLYAETQITTNNYDSSIENFMIENKIWKMRYQTYKKQ